MKIYHKHANEDKSKYSSSHSFVSESDEQSHITRQSESTSLQESPVHPVSRNAFFAQAEEKAVFRIRVALAGFLTTCTIVVVCLVYLNTRNNELSEYEADFINFSSKVFQAFGLSVEESLSAIDSFCVAAVSFSTSMNLTWPFVTIPNIGTRLSKVRSITKAAVIVIAPHVNQAQTEEWNEYYLEHAPEWVEDNLRIQKTDPGFNGVQLEQYDLSPTMFQSQVASGHSHYPLWQQYPSATAGNPPFSMDPFFLSDAQLAMDVMHGYKAYLSAVTNDPSRGATYNSWLADYVRPDFDITEPVGDLYYPMYNDAIDEVTMNVETMQGHGGHGQETAHYEGEPMHNGESHDATTAPMQGHSEHDQEPAHGHRTLMYNHSTDETTMSNGESMNGHASHELETTNDQGTPMNNTSTDGMSMPNTEPMQDQHTHHHGGMVAHIWTTFYWRDFFSNILPGGIEGLVLVVENSCNNSFTYQINGPKVEFLGYGDHHNPGYDHLVQRRSIQELQEESSANRIYSGLPLSDSPCTYYLNIYPSKTFKKMYTSSDPWVYALVAAGIFVFTSIVFWAYDVLVERRQRKVMSTAVKSSAIVSSLFPSNVCDRLYDLEAQEPYPNSQKNRLKSFMNDITPPRRLSDSNFNRDVGTSQPIADLFPEATVMFSDIAGFTAWSSTREPTQVFILLETLYSAFDALAGKRGIFKVETIGDCYVAAAGLPESCPEHALVATKFARDCGAKMMQLVARLSVSLGPDTEDLRMRFGINSGPVTAGVLRGEKSRFQLFGDTVNTASRMESTGEANCIHISQSTADELIKHKKGHWLHLRRDTVEVKGKGQMITYWVKADADDDKDKNKRRAYGTLPYSFSTSNVLSAPPEREDADDKIARLVDWNTEVLARLLCGIVASRDGNGALPDSVPTIETSGTLPIEEVREILTLPAFDNTREAEGAKSVVLEPQVVAQLRDYVVSIAACYHGSNPFHNFAHASHVCMSVAKLMSRIVAADDYYEQEMAGPSMESFKHQQTFGIASDPLVLFACTFAALIHDADHPGVPNTQVIKEGSSLAKKYGNRSVAEQRSVDLAWDMLMQDRFHSLRHTICPTHGELGRFRELIVNIVMATDIMDKELKQVRNDRWDKAFQQHSTAEDDGDEPSSSFSRESINRKATIVIEHLIQASDVAHTMQHWHVFRKWNERLFAEMVQAYQDGRAERNPAEFWYQGELGFFDFYVLPLAKKLSECGVFGVSSDEYLNYAMKNREEWALKGEKVVADMVAKLKPSKQ